MPRFRLKYIHPHQSVADHLHILQRRPCDPFAHSGLAVTYEGLGHIDYALYHYREAVKYNPNDASTCINLACLLLKQGSVKEAQKYCQKALTGGGCAVLAHNTMAAVLGKLDDISGAIYHVEQALVFEPNNPKMHRNLAALMARRSQNKRALKHGKRAVELDPYHVRSRYDYALTLMREGNIPDAAKHAKVGWRMANPGGPHRCYGM